MEKRPGGGDEATFRRFAPDGPNLEKAERITPFYGVIEYPNWVRKPACPGVALIGDAAMSIDPLWGVGCGWAFQTAEWLVETVGVSCQRSDEVRLDRNLEAYARLHKKRLSGHEFLICDYSTGRDYNFIERLMYSAAARDPICGDHLLAFGARSIGVGQFLSPKALARAAWGQCPSRPRRQRRNANACGRGIVRGRFCGDQNAASDGGHG